MSDELSALQADWDALRSLLSTYDGAGARDLIMRDKHDTKRINYLYTRTNDWLVSWFRHRDPKATTADGEDYSEASLWNFVHALWPSRMPVDYTVVDLPRLLDALHAHSVILHKERFPSREVNE